MPQEIDRTHVQRLMREAAQVVEVLPREEFEQDHSLVTTSDGKLVGLLRREDVADSRKEGR